jgi:hypothetical protein
VRRDRPGGPAGSHGAGETEGFAGAFDPRDTSPRDHGQVSAALCAAGRCVAAAEHGLHPAEITLSPGAGGHWRIQIDGLGSRAHDPRLLLAGAAARGLRDDDEDFDLEAVVESGLAIIALQGDFGPPLVAAIKLIGRHEPIVRAIAGQLTVKQVMTGEELATLLRPITGGTP